MAKGKSVQNIDNGVKPVITIPPAQDPTQEFLEVALDVVRKGNQVLGPQAVQQHLLQVVGMLTVDVANLALARTAGPLEELERIKVWERGARRFMRIHGDGFQGDLDETLQQLSDMSEDEFIQVVMKGKRT